MNLPTQFQMFSFFKQTTQTFQIIWKWNCLYFLLSVSSFTSFSMAFFHGYPNSTSQTLLNLNLTITHPCKIGKSYKSLLFKTRMLR